MHAVNGGVQLSWLLAQSCLNVVDCRAFSIRPPELYLIMEWYPMGNLLQVRSCLPWHILSLCNSLSLFDLILSHHDYHTVPHTPYHLYLLL